MWQDKLKEIIYILENSNVNEIEVRFWGRRYRVSKQPSVVVQDSSDSNSQISSQNIKQPTPSFDESQDIKKTNNCANILEHTIFISQLFGNPRNPYFDNTVHHLFEFVCSLCLKTISVCERFKSRTLNIRL